MTEYPETVWLVVCHNTLWVTQSLLALTALGFAFTRLRHLGEARYFAAIAFLTLAVSPWTQLAGPYFSLGSASAEWDLAVERFLRSLSHIGYLFGTLLLIIAIYAGRGLPD